MIHHLVAAMHMLDTYDQSRTWDCPCLKCEATRVDPDLIAALWKEIRKKPPNPSSKPSPPTHDIQL